MLYISYNLNGVNNSLYLHYHSSWKVVTQSNDKINIWGVTPCDCEEQGEPYLVLTDAVIQCILLPQISDCILISLFILITRISPHFAHFIVAPLEGFRRIIGVCKLQK